MKNAILTTYFTSEKDPQRPYAWANDDYSIIKDFYESIIKHDLNCYIFYDNCSDEFVKKFTTDKIKFIKYDARNKNMVDERWSIYSTFITHMDFDKVLCLDISDVVVLKNPFDYMQDDKVYVGDEECLNRQNRWMLDRYEMIGVDLRNVFDKQVLNCGILGGNKDDMRDITQMMADIIMLTNIIDTTVDMAAANHVLYKHFEDRLVHSQPWNTKYRGGAYPYTGDNNGNNECVIQHK